MHKTPTVWQARWTRWHRVVVVTMFVASVLTAVFVSFGVAGVLFVVTLGLAAFGGGKPTENGRTAAPERWLH